MSWTMKPSNTFKQDTMLYIMDLTALTEISDRSTNFHPEISGNRHSSGTSLAT